MFSQTGTDVLPRRDEGSDKPRCGDEIWQQNIQRLFQSWILIFSNYVQHTVNKN